MLAEWSGTRLSCPPDLRSRSLYRPPHPVVPLAPPASPTRGEAKGPLTRPALQAGLSRKGRGGLGSRFPRE